MSHLYSLISLPVSLLDLLLETLLENDVTVRPVITAPPDTDTPLPSPGLDMTEVQLSNLVLLTTPSTLSATRSAVKKYHRRRKEKRFGRGFRLNRNKERR